MKRDTPSPINDDPAGLLSTEVNARIAQLSPEKRALLLKRLSDGSKEPGRHQIRSIRSDDRRLELSYAQQRLWFLEQWASGSALYNIPRAWSLEGALEPDRLRVALAQLVARHESLRTALIDEQGQPHQLVLADVSVELTVVDLRTQPLEQARAQALTQAQSLAGRGFDLTRPPLLRAALFRVAESSHVLVLVMHHIVSDGWSMGVLCRELSTFYAGHGEQLPPLPLHYADYAQWQREALRGVALERQLSYWRAQLATLSTLELPTDRPRPPAQSYRGAQHPIALSTSLSAALKQLCQHERVTLYMMLLAAFQVLLARYSGQNDIAVGSPIAGRTRSEFEGLIGFFVNTLVMRTDLTGNPSFRDLLARVRENALEAYAHQDVPFEKLVEELKPERELSRNPLIQVMFALQNAPGGELELPALVVTAVALDNATAKFDLTLTLSEGESGLHGELSYATDLFDTATIARMEGHFRTLLEGIVAAPDTPINVLPLLTSAESHQLLVEWNDTAAEYPEGRCIHQLFEAQAARTPEAVAVIFKDRQLSYAELNVRANQLAHYLRSKGVGPEVLVGICLERSLELVIGLLGILKAGGAYVPLDPGYPQECLAFMIEDAQASLLLTQQGLLVKLPSFDGTIVCLDLERKAIAAQPHTNLPAHATAENLAYVIYTSGSTGRPKGIAIEHRSAVTFLHWTAEVFSDNELAGTLFSTSVCFDLSVFELFAPLNQGGTVIMAENALQLPTLLGAQQITLINTVPSAITELLRMRGVPVSVRTINLAGEPLPGSLARDIYELKHVDKLYNLYGPTEDTIYSTFALVARGDAGAPTIGRPIANSQIYILDRYGEPVPEGIHGELYVAGAGLARGYLNRPELTSEKFLPDPFSAVPGTRMYRTGDLAHYLPDGNIAFLGRADDQVKLRGFRIELGEIESLLRQHAAVKDAVVILREDTPGDQRLAAYVVAERDAVPSPALTNMLKAKLPEYMVPADIVFLETLPLTSNGKIDRKSMPAPAHDRSLLENKFIAPRTPHEKEIARIWGEVMSLENPGIHDNFFELGGHSLLATRVISRINFTFGIQLPLRELFESPTIAGLAQSLLVNESLATRETSPQKSTLKSLADRSSLPLSFAQQRLWFLDQFEHGSANYNIPCAYRIRGSLNIDALRHALNEVIRRHESLRTTFAMQGDEPVQVIAPDLELAIPLLGANDEATLHNLIIAEAKRTFDLQQGPLLNAQIIRLAPEDHALFFNLHHIISDGWSMGVFLRELNQLYAAFIKGEPSPLTEPGLQYADYAVWQRQQGEELAKQLDYWKQKLAAPPVLELPTDHPRPPVQRYRGAILSWHVAAPLTAQLKQLAQQEYATLFMLLMASLQTLLYRYSGQEDFTVGSPVAGRNHAELEGMIGLFVNTMVLRADLSDSPTFLQLLTQVRKTSLAALIHQDIPFEKLVEELLSTRDVSRNPLFQVMFTLQNTPSSQLVLNGTEIEAIEIPIETGKFDLSLAVTESNQGLECTFNYNTDLFDKTTIERMAGHLQNLLQEVVANPQRSIAELPLLAEDEKQQILKEWNNTGKEYPSDKTIHALFEEQVQATPDAVALVFGNQQLTYAELNARANQLAHLLIAKGIETEMTVALLMDRSTELLISILAILKAGGAYVPLDPKHPWDRLQTILDDAAPKLLLTTWGQHELLTGHLNVSVLIIDTLQSDSDAEDQRNPDLLISPDNLAYVLYTSGSTGIPKGVMIEHGSVINLACALQTQVFDSFDKSPLRVALNTAITFDASVQQWTRLLWGDCIVILPEEVSRDTQALVAALRAQHADVLGCSPMQLRLMFDEGLFNDVGNCPDIMLCGGEAIDAELWRLASTQQHSHIYNVYGPTECTVDSTSCLLDAKTGIPNIGRPLANVQAYILDRNHQPVPIGIPGELWLGGAGVGRGYLNKPELTVSSFIPDTYANSPNARLYNTGDRARYMPDGNIEFLGRADGQVKLRGFRIELGEIESVLRQHPSVKNAVAIVREDTPGDKRLVAYAVAERDAVPQHALTNMLKAKLPEYMVPADIVFLETLPLTSSGKVDRKSLPAPVHDRSRLMNQYIAPRTPYEKEIARIWGEVMSLENPGLHDNFFELGGHSLLATRVISRINCAFGIQLPLRNIFESPTIVGLAQTLLINKSRVLQEVALTTLLDQLENLSEAEAEQLLAEKTAGEKS